VQEDWEQHGKKIIKKMREKFPEIYFQSMVKLAVVHRVEVGQPKAFDKPRTVKEALDQLEERVGTKGRRLFEEFLHKAEQLEAEENSARPRRASGRSFFCVSEGPPEDSSSTVTFLH
jgi:hypothetical protein